MDAYANVFTIEANGPKGWEIIWTRSNLANALEVFKRAVQETDGTEYRLTTPSSNHLLESLGV